MDKRKRVGLIFSYNEEWIGGTYYILNIIHALQCVDDVNKPTIVLLSDKKENFNLVKQETSYPYIEFFKIPLVREKFTLVDKIINKVSYIFLKKLPIKKGFIPPNIDMLYPSGVKNLAIDKLKKINWIPDFQEAHLPQYFSEQEIEERKKFQKEVVCEGDIVVFSSEDSKQDFELMYKNTEINKVVLNFAVTHPDYSSENINKLVTKYALPNAYFFSPNQFWAHKNHIVILKAVKELKEQGCEIVVAFSGKERDYRNLENFTSLKAYITDNKLEANIKFLGFISREEQLCLMKHAIAIVQPSLFEGWSTVVEDAKALNKHIILSNINVHTEQIKQNMSFFKPNNEKDLATILKQFNLVSPVVEELDYQEDITKFGEAFLKLVNLATRENNI